MADKNFIVKNGLEVGGQEVISSSGVVTSAALGGQTLSSTDSPTFANLTVSNDLAVSGDLNLTGDLNITGDLNSLSVTDLDVTDQTITLGAGQVESASGGSGIVVAGSNASLLWDETNDVFDFNKGVTSTGNVGIGAGATSPSNLLHVQESQASSTLVYFKNGSATAGSVLALDTGGTGTATKIFDARVSGTSKFMIYGDGTAEIARPTSSNSEVPLLVLSGPQGIMRLGDGQDAQGGPHGIQFDYYGAGVTDGMSMYYRTSPQALSFEDSRGTSGNKVMVIERTGNVGIGTDEPDFKLHISGGNTTGGIFVEDSSTSNSSPVIKVQGKRSDANKSQSFSGGLVLEALYSGGLAPNTKHTGTIYFGTNHTDGTVANIAYSASISGILEGDANSATDMPTGLAFYTGDAGTALGTAQTTYGTERMRIDHDGQVGIGTTSPALGLHVADTKGVLFGPSGIGASTYISPDHENTINGGYGLDTDTADVWINYRGYQNGTSRFRDFRVGNGKEGLIAFFDGSSGRVGIGTVTPTDKLHVVQDTGNDRSIIVAESTVGGSAEAGIAVRNTAGEGRFVIGGADHVFIENAIQGKDLYFATYPTGGSESTERARIHAGGGLSIGTSNIPASTDGALVLANGGAGGPSSTQPNGGLWIEDAGGTPQLTLYRASGNALRLDGQGSNTVVFDNSGNYGFHFEHGGSTLLEINDSNDGKIITYLPIEAIAANDHFKSGVFYNVGENPINNPWHTCTQINSSGAGGGTADCGDCVDTTGTITGCAQGTGSAYNWYSAKRYCELAGMRLCTRAEVIAGAGNGTGCQHNNRGQWTSTKGTTDSTKYFIVQGDGNGTSATAEQENYPYDTTITGFTTNNIGIRCCQQNSWS